MNIISICSALNNSYIALEFDGQMYSKILKTDENYHSLYLISEIKKLTKENNIDLKKLDLICVNSGPGSFTGIRVAMSIAKVMAGELDKPLVTLNTAEILLNAYNMGYLVMDARRDMFFIATKNNIELKLKNEVVENYKDEKVLCDKNSQGYFKNSVCYEDLKENIALTMIKLAKEKYNNSTSKDEFYYLKAQANYIQTPPVFG